MRLPDYLRSRNHFASLYRQGVVSRERSVVLYHDQHVSISRDRFEGGNDSGEDLPRAPVNQVADLVSIQLQADHAGENLVDHKLEL
jgi:hypothetical protein